MEKQQNFTDIEYTNRRRTTKREAFLENLCKFRKLLNDHGLQKKFFD